uniref:Uncharacterized protein n=1 Tax=Arundo donax TaxID=35708 RepID=A0A0A8ZRX0_ARUDO
MGSIAIPEQKTEFVQRHILSHRLIVQNKFH